MRYKTAPLSSFHQTDTFLEVESHSIGYMRMALSAESKNAIAPARCSQSQPSFQSSLGIAVVSSMWTFGTCLIQLSLHWPILTSHTSDLLSKRCNFTLYRKRCILICFGKPHSLRLSRHTFAIIWTINVHVWSLCNLIRKQPCWSRA